MVEDKVLTLKEWIDSFWKFQEEDLRFFKEEIYQMMKNPRELLNELRERMRTRQVYYRLFKHLSWRDLPKEELTWACDRLDEILARETMITEIINKILDFLSEIFFGEDSERELKTFQIELQEKPHIFH